MTSLALLILAIDSATFETVVMGWISVITVVGGAVLFMAAKLLPQIAALVKQFKDAIHGVANAQQVIAENQKTAEDRLDRHREEINNIKKEGK